MKWLFGNLGTKLLALLGALLLWTLAHSTSSVEERGFDVPVVPVGLPSDLVLTDISSDVVNVRVRGARAALRSLSVGELEYAVDLSGAKPGTTTHQVESSDFQLPRGAEAVSRSPSSIEFTVERRSSKFVKLRADLEGQLPDGYKIGTVELIPPRVRVTGARSEVLRMNEVLTETVDVTGLTESLERTVRPALGDRHVWLENNDPIRLRVEVIPPPPAPAQAAPAPDAKPSAKPSAKAGAKARARARARGKRG